MEEAMVAAVLVAQVIVHILQETLSGLDIVIFRQILGAGITT
jgi:ABC-type Na+ transport system ATPase subunit NatA